MRAALFAVVQICLLMTAGHGAWAQSGVTFDFDDPPDTTHRLTDTLSYGADIELETRHERNFNLEKSVDDDETSLEPTMDLAFTYQPNDVVRAFVDFELSKIFVVDSPDGSDSRDTKLEVKEANVTLREIYDGLSLQLGRQQFQDELEWIYEDELDAARAYYRIGSVALEASASVQGDIDKDLFNDDDEDKFFNAFLVGHYTFTEDSGASAYFLMRDGREDDHEDLYFLGVQSIGELAPDFDYWINAAYVFGDRSSDNGSRDIRGFGADLIATRAFDLPWEPSLTLGFAFASGDDKPDNGTDANFRQTGLQANNAEFNGVTRFQYYGEVLDPELSNLAVFTLGAGVRPSEDSSIDLVYHYYRQHQAAGELRDSNLDTEPDGRHRELGHAVDLVFGFLEFESFSSELVVGAFFPGRAFESGADNAYFAGLEFQYEF
jgi:alginate production protein